MLKERVTKVGRESVEILCDMPGYVSVVHFPSEKAIEFAYAADCPVGLMRNIMATLVSPFGPTRIESISRSHVLGGVEMEHMLRLSYA